MAIVVQTNSQFVLFVFVVAPITWLLYKIIPNGRIMFLLFKVRSGKHASRRDKWVMTLAVFTFYLLMIGALALYFRFRGGY